jgi:hypothetical protein
MIMQSGFRSSCGFATPMVTWLKSSKNREDNPMKSGIVRTALTNELPLELEYREPFGARTEARSREWAVNSEDYFERIKVLIANDFKRLMSQI